ncbi:hypothetical protein KBC99_03200 [Candidatus Saccharibacteria bacterium]|nr:hypothetical protein [Candidatus Saccharibacteria bacterium]
MKSNPNLKRLATIIGIALFAIIIVIVTIMTNQKTPTPTDSRYVKNSETGEELFNDPNQNPEKNNKYYLSLIGVDPLTASDFNPAQVESLRTALQAWVEKNLPDQPDRAYIIKPTTNALTEDEGGAFNIKVKFGTSDTTYDIKMYKSEIGVSIYINGQGPLYGKTDF